MIGDKIREFRKKRGWTQVQLGEKIGVQGATVTRYEKGAIVPNYDTIKSIANALGIPITELLSDEQLESKKLDAANRGLIAMLESVYETVNFDWKHIINSDGEHEYDGDFSVTLSKNGEVEIILDKREWEILFSYVCQNIPVHIKFILEQYD